MLENRPSSPPCAACQLPGGNPEPLMEGPTEASTVGKSRVRGDVCNTQLAPAQTFAGNIAQYRQRDPPFTEEIAAIETNGIRTADGYLHPLDVIVYATGFHADYVIRPMAISGHNGARLEDFWADRPKAYLAVTMPRFPNLFVLNGDCKHPAPSHTAMRQFEAERIAAAKKTVWYLGGCVRWYLDESGIPSSWPWNFSRVVASMAAPDWSAFGLMPPPGTKVRK